MLVSIFLIIVSVQICYLFLSNKIIGFLLFRSPFTSFLGLPGVGKSSLAALIQYYANNVLHVPVYSNFVCSGTYQYDVSDLGRYEIESAVLLLDEAGIDLSNRKLFEKSYNGIKENNRRFWKLHRHFGMRCFIFSQAQDFDITLRRLSQKIYIITKCGLFLHHWSKLVPLKMKWDINQEGTDPEIHLTIVPFFRIFFDRFPYYNQYDSYEVPELEHKEFEYIPQKAKNPYFARFYFINRFVMRLIDKIPEWYEFVPYDWRCELFNI